MTFSVATFNVKDLFDATDDASRALLDAKLSCLAEVLERADADVVALQEVGSASVVRALCARASRLGYREPIFGTADARGIACAVVARAPVLAAHVHETERLSFPAFYTSDPAPFGARLPLRRGIVHARLDAGSLGPVDLLVAHLKSNRAVPLCDDAGAAIAPVTERDFAEGHLRSLVWRASEALFVRGLVDDLLAENPARHLVVAGDLNDHAESQVVRIIAGGGGPAALAKCAEAVPQVARFSILYRGLRQQLDHILATQGLRERQQSARFLNDALRDHGELPDEAPMTPDSDHAALVVSFASAP